MSVGSVASEAPQMTGKASERVVSRATMRVFLTWTAVFWGGVGVCALLFYVGVLDFTTSTKTALYGISIWLNAWVLVFFIPANKGRPKLDLYHDALVVWFISYALTNLLWEIPWVSFSPFVFENMNTLDEIERSSLDYYASVRSLYQQSRKNAIRNGAPDFDDLPDF